MLHVSFTNITSATQVIGFEILEFMVVQFPKCQRYHLSLQGSGGFLYEYCHMATGDNSHFFCSDIEKRHQNLTNELEFDLCVRLYVKLSRNPISNQVGMTWARTVIIFSLV